MANKIKLDVESRELVGKKVKKLRSEGIIPANVYGSKIESKSVQITLEDFQKTYKQAGETNIIELNVKGEKKSRPVLFSNIQVSPVNRDILHVDLRQVDLTQKIAAEVPVEFINESPAEAAGGVLIKLVDSIAVEALPAEIPEKFEIDISKIENIGDMITIETINAPKGVVITDTEDTVLVRVDQKKEKEEPEEDQLEVETESEAESEAESEDAQEKDEKSESEKTPKE